MSHEVMVMIDDRVVGVLTLMLKGGQWSGAGLGLRRIEGKEKVGGCVYLSKGRRASVCFEIYHSLQIESPFDVSIMLQPGCYGVADGE